MFEDLWGAEEEVEEEEVVIMIGGIVLRVSIVSATPCALLVWVDDNVCLPHSLLVCRVE